eukprot:CAMPEP_0201248954 /NCGR_PEP_ID=MMETSP0852-20130820/58066_1 /ASSEMBLY_ACC=CAM_ASM_000632 /TAXON_ID=183588 /ORGANISM="Pseudo-nitzschia fraudulenta, Strain WWA7" /LENGTH=89 /DNA_ID=CAMNT_0047547863 /DNA_START=38 /DNA_END=304 /DNA_ORIENTATION=-
MKEEEEFPADSEFLPEVGRSPGPRPGGSSFVGGRSFFKETFQPRFLVGGAGMEERSGFLRIAAQFDLFLVVVDDDCPVMALPVIVLKKL